ncbi:MAG: enoyl-CoA hydratase/isomerase family protein [Pseudomonadota bacterium]
MEAVSAPVHVELLPTACGRAIAVATLDAERSLNSLTLAMVDALLPRLASWADDDHVVAVLLRGRGERAFCAGGDVRALTQHARTGEGDAGYPAHFFAREYRLDYAIREFPKPLLVWGTGVVMGGGMGLLLGASFRVATETTRMAMPEITIGLYPDVGGSYFLSRLPGRVGLFMGLTACQFGASDALALGLASHVASSESWSLLLSQLQSQHWPVPASAQAEVVARVLQQLPQPELAVGPLQQHAEQIAELTHHDSLSALDQAWREIMPEAPWLAKAVQAYRTGSPTSAALIWKQWHESAELTLAEVFRIEWMLSSQCALHPDFPEGVRALLIDKDMAPRWQPAKLADVSAAWVAGHYAIPQGMTQPLVDLEQCFSAGRASA